jgi:putative addiction module component (TIGR02574 family)
MNATLASEISRLTPAEKLQLVEELWDEIAKSEDQLPIPEWHRQILAEDEARYQANPTAGAPWAEVKARLFRRP